MKIEDQIEQEAFSRYPDNQTSRKEFVEAATFGTSLTPCEELKKELQEEESHHSDDVIQLQQRISELEAGLNDLRLSIVDKNFYNSHATAIKNAKQLLNL